MESKIGELLEKLRKLDVATWADYQATRDALDLICDHWPEEYNDREDEWGLQNEMPESHQDIDDGLLIIKITKAIAARGWFFAISYSPQDKSVDVKIRDHGFVEGRGIWPLLAHVLAKGTAETLVAAYVAALEAQDATT